VQNNEGEALAYVYEQDENILFHPFLLRNIHSHEYWKNFDLDIYDIESVRGYSGPLATTTEKSFLKNAWNDYYTWCHEKQVAAEYIRFNMFSKNEKYIDENFNLFCDLDAAWFDMALPFESIWTEGYTSVHRNMIRKAEKNNLEFRIGGYSELHKYFFPLYIETMDRTGASDLDFYTDHYYRMLGDLKQRALYGAVFYRGKPLSVGVFLLDDKYIYYHLVGNSLLHRELAANNFLLHKILLWGLKNGKIGFFVGGGSQNTSACLFKKRLSKNRIPYVSGRIIHNKQTFDFLISHTAEEVYRTHASHTFPYRFM
jgi:hypothetical protein